MPTPRSILAIIVMIGVGVSSGCVSVSPSVVPGASLVKGGSGFAISLGGLKAGQVVLFLAPAVVNVDTHPITIKEVRPRQALTGLVFESAWYYAASEDAPPVTWSGTVAQEKKELGDQMRSVSGLVVAPGSGVSSILLRYIVEVVPSRAQVVQGVEIVYDVSGTTCVEEFDEQIEITNG